MLPFYSSVSKDRTGRKKIQYSSIFLLINVTFNWLYCHSSNSDSSGYHAAFSPKMAIDEIHFEEKKVSRLLYVCSKNPLVSFDPFIQSYRISNVNDVLRQENGFKDKKMKK